MIRPKRREGRKAGMQCTFESFGSVCLRNNWMRLLDNFTWLITRTISQTHFCHRRETGSVFPRHRYSKLMTFKEIVLNKNRFLLSTTALWAALVAVSQLWKFHLLIYLLNKLWKDKNCTFLISLCSSRAWNFIHNSMKVALLHLINESYCRGNKSFWWGRGNISQL